MVGSVSTISRVAVNIGTARVPLYTAPYNPLQNIGATWEFLNTALYPVAQFVHTSSLGSRIVDACDFRIFTPFSEWRTRFNAAAGTQDNTFNGAWHGQYAIGAMTWISSASTPVNGYYAPVPIGANLVLGAWNNGYTLYNPLRPELPPFATGVGSVSTSSDMAVFVQNNLPAFGMMIRTDLTRQGMLFWPIRAGTDYVFVDAWHSPDIPLIMRHNVPVPGDPLYGAGEYNSSFIEPNASDHPLVLGLFAVGGNLQKVNVGFGDTALNTAFNSSNLRFAGASVFGHLFVSGTPRNGQGVTAIVMKPDGTQYFFVEFYNAAGIAAISSGIAAGYDFKIDPLGVFYMKPDGTNTSVFNSLGLALSFIMPTGGLQPVTLPCWNPCVPPQFLQMA